jgi:hypothetical protein
LGRFGIESEGLVEALDGLIVLALHTKSNAFVIPSRGLLHIDKSGGRITLNGLVVTLDSFIIFSQRIETLWTAPLIVDS